jgi:DNA-3-methyladenine glycosylase
MSAFAGDVIDVARDLIGRRLLVTDANRTTCATIVETEAYGGPDDPASHAAFRPGGRAAIMAGPPGYVYVYAAYGMYPCFNIVTGPEGVASAVLLRGVLLAGTELPILGPGRLTRALGIGLADQGSDLRGSRFGISIERDPYVIKQTPRVGIRRGQDIPWRFFGTEREIPD